MISKCSQAQAASGGATPSPTLRGRVLRYAARSPGRGGSPAASSSSGGSSDSEADATGLACEEPRPKARDDSAARERIAAVEAQIQRLTEARRLIWLHGRPAHGSACSVL